MPEQERELRVEHTIFVQSDELKYELPFLDHKRMVVVNDGRGNEIAQITLGQVDLESPCHYIVRPPGCTREALAKGKEDFALTPGSPGTIFVCGKVGGHYHQGATIAVGNAVLTLPMLHSRAEQVNLAQSEIKRP